MSEAPERAEVHITALGVNVVPMLGWPMGDHAYVRADRYDEVVTMYTQAVEQHSAAVKRYAAAVEAASTFFNEIHDELPYIWSPDAKMRLLDAQARFARALANQ